MNAIETVKETSDAVRQHGLAVVLAVVFSVCLLFFAWSQWQTSENRSEKWREMQRQDITELRKDLSEAQTFAQTKLVETIDRNSEALEGLVDEIKR